VWGKTSTVLQAGTLATAVAVNAFLPGLLGFAQLLFRLSLFMTLFSGWDYLRRASKIVRGELPQHA
jgi:hypothetical protein